MVKINLIKKDFDKRCDEFLYISNGNIALSLYLSLLRFFIPPIFSRTLHALCGE